MKPAPTPLTDLEKVLVAKVCSATFPPGTSAKRFMRDLAAGYIKQLTENGRCFLAFIAHRFRRQYELTEDEWAWVRE
jgi:hypothetical protein